MSVRDGLVAVLSALLALAVSWGVMGKTGLAQRQDMGAMETRLAERIDKLEGQTDKLSDALAQCRRAGSGLGATQ